MQRMAVLAGRVVGLTIGVAGGLMVALGIFWALYVAWNVMESPFFPGSRIIFPGPPREIASFAMAAFCTGAGLVAMGLGNFVARRRTRSTS